MKKLEIMLAGVLAFSPALFAQQSTSSTDSQSSAQSSSQSGQTESGNMAKTGSRSKLTADQKAELKQLRAKVKDACKTDKKSDACKTARQDLRAKMDEYGVAKKHHKATTSKGAGTQSPS